MSYRASGPIITYCYKGGVPHFSVRIADCRGRASLSCGTRKAASICYATQETSRLASAFHYLIAPSLADRHRHRDSCGVAFGLELCDSLIVLGQDRGKFLRSRVPHQDNVTHYQSPVRW